MEMLTFLLFTYLYTILTAFFTTLFLILCGYSWGELPHYYLKLILYLQRFFTVDGVVLPSIERSPSSTCKWLFGRSFSNAVNDDVNNHLNEEESENGNEFCSSCEKLDTAFSDLESNAASNEIAVPGGVNLEDGNNASTTPFEWNLELIRDGIESIIQDDISEIFTQSAAYRNAEPRSLRDLFFYYKRERKWQHHLKQKHEELKLDVSATIIEEENGANENNDIDKLNEVYIKRNVENLPPLKFHPFLRSCLLLLISRIFRGGILFPIRLGLFVSSFVFLITMCTLAWFIDFSNQGKTKIAVIYCRMFSAGTGLVARYHNIKHRPVRPGVAVANHLSPNDIQIICADINMDRDYLYIVTGQKHNGILWAIEHFVEKLCLSIWLERSSTEDRKKFTQAVLDVAKVSGPILIFPEGYCTNNQKVLQFRRAVFEEDVIIHPIAIRQDARFGDSFWSEDQFFCYLGRILTSWAIVYDVIYLPAQKRMQDETSTQFAARVQVMISETVGVECANFDGGLFYKEDQRKKYREVWIKECGKRVQEMIKTFNYPLSCFSSASDSTSNDGADENFESCIILNNGTPEFSSPKVGCCDIVSQKSVDDLISVSRTESDASLTDQETEPSLVEDMSATVITELQFNEFKEGVDGAQETDFWNKMTTVNGNAPSYKVLQRKRYNSLSLLQRQVSIDDDLNG